MTGWIYRIQIVIAAKSRGQTTILMLISPMADTADSKWLLLAALGRSLPVIATKHESRTVSRPCSR